MSELYENLLKATDNTSDITNEKYGTITKLENNIASVKEMSSDLEHSNVPIMNGLSVKLGDKVILGFIENSPYNPVVYGVIGRTLTSIDNELSTTSENPVQNKVITNSLNNKSDINHTHISSQVTDLIEVIYPIGSIYITVNNVNPSLLFGGEWTQLKDRFLVGVGDNYNVKDEGGEETHTLTKEEMPSHTHIQNSHNHTQNGHTHGTTSGRNFIAVGDGDNWSYTSAIKIATGSSGTAYYYPHSDKNHIGITEPNNTASTTATNNSATATNQNNGGGQAHNNLPPYLAVYMWERTG